MTKKKGPSIVRRNTERQRDEALNKLGPEFVARAKGFKTYLTEDRGHKDPAVVDNYMMRFVFAAEAAGKGFIDFLLSDEELYDDFTRSRGTVGDPKTNIFNPPGS